MTRSHARRGAIAVTAVSFLAGCAAFPNPDAGAPTAHHSAGLPSAGHCSGAPGAGTPAALAPLLRHQAASMAVGVLDQTTGAAPSYCASRSFDTASIVKADILAVLLLQHQQIGAPLSRQEQELAARMIEGSDNAAASALWNAVEGGPGMEAGNAALGLRDTWPALNGCWGLNTTTVADQLRLLADLTSSRSPLHASARRYELGLMQAAEQAKTGKLPQPLTRAPAPRSRTGGCGRAWTRSG